MSTEIKRYYTTFRVEPEYAIQGDIEEWERGKLQDNISINQEDDYIRLHLTKETEMQ